MSSGSDNLRIVVLGENGPISPENFVVCYRSHSGDIVGFSNIEGQTEEEATDMMEAMQSLLDHIHAEKGWHTQPSF